MVFLTELFRFFPPWSFSLNYSVFFLHGLSHWIIPFSSSMVFLIGLFRFLLPWSFSLNYSVFFHHGLSHWIIPFSSSMVFLIGLFRFLPPYIGRHSDQRPEGDCAVFGKSWARQEARWPGRGAVQFGGRSRVTGRLGVRSGKLCSIMERQTEFIVLMKNLVVSSFPSVRLQQFPAPQHLLPVRSGPNRGGNGEHSIRRRSSRPESLQQYVSRFFRVFLIFSFLLGIFHEIRVRNRIPSIRTLFISFSSSLFTILYTFYHSSQIFSLFWLIFLIFKFLKIF